MDIQWDDESDIPVANRWPAQPRISTMWVLGDAAGGDQQFGLGIAETPGRPGDLRIVLVYARDGLMDLGVMTPETAMRMHDVLVEAAGMIVASQIEKVEKMLDDDDEFAGPGYNFSKN